MIIFILLFGIFLRVYNIGATYFFEGELGKEMLYLRQYFLAGRLPTIGMTTSHEWLSYGPFYYWVMMPIFALFKGDPFILFWTALIVSVAGMIVGYIVLTKIASKKVALISTIITAISPLLIMQTKLSKLHAFFFILSPVFMYLLYLMWNGNKKWVFWAGIVFGLMFSFHFSQIPLFGVVILLFWIKKNIYKWTDWIKFGAGVLIPNLTLIWQDRNLALWVPYRIANIAYKDPAGTLVAFIEYFGRNIFWNHAWWTAGFVLFMLIFAHYAWTNWKKLTTDFLPFYLSTSIGLMLVANILHGAFPIHYFLPVLTTVPILYAVYISKYRLGILILILIFAFNLKSYFTFERPDAYIPYTSQLVVADFIIADAKGAPLSIKKVGPYDYFPENYSQNYKYVILWKGGNLIENSVNTYTIVETDGNINVQK